MPTTVPARIDALPPGVPLDVDALVRATVPWPGGPTVLRLPPGEHPWTLPWIDPSQHQAPGFPRMSTLNEHLAVHAPLHVWRQAGAWAREGSRLGPLGMEGQATDLLAAQRAVVHHPAGTLERFEALLDDWVNLVRVHPQAAATAWERQHWKTTTHGLSPRAHSRTDHEHWRLRWVNQWLNAGTATRRDDPAGLDRGCSWVQAWLNDGRLTLEQLVHRRYQALGERAPDEDAPSAGNGLLMAWRYASVTAMEAWTRWERGWYGPEVIDRQWRRAIACQHPDTQDRPAIPLHEHPLGTPPGDGQDRREAWRDWGVRRIRAGDPSPLDLPMPVPLFAKTSTPPMSTLDRWAQSGDPHPLAVPPSGAPELALTAQVWTRAVLEQIAQQTTVRAPKKDRPRL